MIESLRLSKTFNGGPAVDALDLTIKPGEVFCLLGANGAGKTTTIECREALLVGKCDVSGSETWRLMKLVGVSSKGARVRERADR